MVAATGRGLVYNTADIKQDPMFVADRNGANRKRILLSEPGVRYQYPVWSPDGRYIYFARGIMNPIDMDIWRIPSDGGTIERADEPSLARVLFGVPRRPHA